MYLWISSWIEVVVEVMYSAFVDLNPHGAHGDVIADVHGVIRSRAALQ